MLADIDTGPPWIAAVTAVAVAVGLVSQIVLQVLARYQAQQTARKTEAGMAQVQQTASKAVGRAHQAVVLTAEGNAKIDETLSAVSSVHDLVNGGHLAQLQLHARTARRLADLSRDPRDLQAALAAEQALAEQRARQAQAGPPAPDAKEKT